MELVDNRDHLQTSLADGTTKGIFLLSTIGEVRDGPMSLREDQGDELIGNGSVID